MEIDSQLIAKCINAERKAQQALFEACFPFLVRLCRIYSRDDQEAMSHLNEGFYKILKGLPTWKQHIPFENWAKRIMLNAIIDNYRRQKSYRQQQAMSPEDIKALEQNISVVQVESPVVDAEEMLDWLRDLPVLTSQIFGLYAIDGYSYEEISNWLEMKQVTIRWHVWEARKKLAKRFETVIKSHQKNL
jgi:RNA polymerase sigma factor (sigma-70 family)